MTSETPSAALAARSARRQEAMQHEHHEHHHHEQVGWLRASVLGANDGLLSTAALLTGVAASQASTQQLVLTGIAALVAGAFSMAAGEYVSVSSQADTQAADLAIEARELRKNPEMELLELTHIYVKRGLDEDLARQVATQLMEHDALGSHARDELGLTEMAQARPIQAAGASALSFAAGAVFPVLAAAFAPRAVVLPLLFAITLVLLASLGAVAARAGGAPMWRGSLRVLFWGALSLVATTIIGHLLGAQGI
ncbi:VIT family protein [Acidithiobacillus sp.]|uniref:VIT1/CCC1 transporter family protein n=1 Tax=Acidithiobacillus sp. TaxID=1872118 RepID=UPI0025C33652|nr:VIT family protein [Acidithiobacillus sp.]